MNNPFWWIFFMVCCNSDSDGWSAKSFSKDMPSRIFYITYQAATPDYRQLNKRDLLTIIIDIQTMDVIWYELIFKPSYDTYKKYGKSQLFMSNVGNVTEHHHLNM